MPIAFSNTLSIFSLIRKEINWEELNPVTAEVVNLIAGIIQPEINFIYNVSSAFSFLFYIYLFKTLSFSSSSFI